MAIGAVRWIGASWAMAWPVRRNTEVSSSMCGYDRLAIDTTKVCVSTVDTP